MGASSWAEFAERFGTEQEDERDYLAPSAIVKTGFRGLDEHLAGGLRQGPHVLMAAPGCGKSSLALSIALNVSLGGRRVLFCSLEMGRQQCLARLCSRLSVDPKSGLSTPVEWSSWEYGGKRTANALRAGNGGAPDSDPQIAALRRLSAVAGGLAIADGEDVADCTSLRRTAEEGKEAGLNLLVIDYLQRLRPPQGLEGADNIRRVSETSQAVTSIAKDLGLPVLVISSMGRDAMKAGKPSLFGGKGSGDIEFDAVSVWQLMQNDGQTRDGTDLVDLHITKARMGRCTGGKPLSLVFDGAHSQFLELR